jgi:Holliday junction resolvasome RuvABC endonuclease subunit
VSTYVLGIDPSLTATAIASSAGWVEVTGAAGHRGDTYADRLLRLDGTAGQVCNYFSPSRIELAVIEGPAYSRGDPSMFDRAYLWWRIYGYLSGHGVPVAVVTPNQRMLYATGKGLASKGAVIDQVARRWPQYETAGDDNAADAVVLMAMGLDWLGDPLSVMPAANRKALEKVAWPPATWPGIGAIDD